MFNYKVFENLCKKSGTTAYQVSKETGVETSTLTNWKKHYESNGKNGYVPKADKILLIANYFDVSLDKFMKWKETHEQLNNNRI